MRHPPGGGKKIVTRHAKKIKLYESNNLAKTMSYNNEAAWHILKRHRQTPISTGKRFGSLRGKTILLDTLDIKRLQLRREFLPETARHHFRYVQLA